MNLSHRTDKFYLKGAISETDTDGYSSFVAKKNTANYGKRGDELYLEKAGYQNITGSVKAGYNFNDSNKIDLSHTIIDADGNFDNTTSKSTSTPVKNVAAKTETSSATNTVANLLDE